MPDNVRIKINDDSPGIVRVFSEAVAAMEHPSWMTALAAAVKESGLAGAGTQPRFATVAASLAAASREAVTPSPQLLQFGRAFSQHSRPFSIAGRLQLEAGSALTGPSARLALARARRLTAG